MSWDTLPDAANMSRNHDTKDEHMTYPTVTEISSARQTREQHTPTTGRAGRYVPLTAAEMRDYRSRCAEIRALDARADRARSAY